jgi:hypothetical protein
MYSKTVPSKNSVPVPSLSVCDAARYDRLANGCMKKFVRLPCLERNRVARIKSILGFGLSFIAQNLPVLFFCWDWLDANEKKRGF